MDFGQFDAAYYVAKFEEVFRTAGFEEHFTSRTAIAAPEE